MQSRVVGPMESWRGRVRRASRGAREWFSAPWRGGTSPGQSGVNDAENGSRPGMSDNGGGEEERIARGTGVKEQISRGEAVRELNSAGETNSAGAINSAGATNSAGEPGRKPGGGPDHRRTVPEQSRVPSWLATASAWAWRLLLLAVVIYLIARVLGILYIVVVPCIAALLLTAILQPLTARLRRAGLPALAATWVTLLIAAVVVGGLVTLVANRVSADYPTLLAEAKHTTAQIQSWLAGPPFHLKSTNVQKYLNNIPGYLSQHRTLVEGTVVTGGKIASEFFGGLVLMLFVTFFLLKDGERIWSWLLGAMRTPTARRMDRAGPASWLVLVYYMAGTAVVAA